ncbi:MAG: CsgG/HfaB family protein [Woeseia sp.]|nr:CsgG/HfaB family protein [Woeseia sp.]
MKLPAMMIGVAAMVFIFTGAPASADFVGYSVGKKDRSPLPARLDDVDTKYLVNIEWGDYGGRKSRLGVLEVDNTSSSSSFRVSSAGGNIDYSSSSNGVPVNGIEAIVIDSLARTNRFRLVERTVLSDVLGEQDLASSGRVAQASGAATGNVLGAEYLVQVVVTDYESNTSGKSGGVGGLLRNKVPILGGVKMGKGTGRVGLNFRLINAETSEIVFTKQIESVINESSLSLGGIGFGSDIALGGFFSSYSRTPIGQAVIAGINQGVFDLIKEIGAKGAEGSIVKADTSQIYVNLGEDSVSVGDVLEVREKGEELIDPETGISLGGAETVLGTIRVSQVQEKFSIAEPVSLGKTPARGAKVVSMIAPPPLEFANSFSKPK